jgi:hypothetical protein
MSIDDGKVNGLANDLTNVLVNDKANNYDNNLDLDLDLDSNERARMIKKLDVKLIFAYDLKEIESFGHRSGWINVIKQLHRINNRQSDNEILFLDFIEKTLSWGEPVDKNNNPTIIVNFSGEKHTVPINSIKVEYGSWITKINGIFIKRNNNRNHNHNNNYSSDCSDCDHNNYSFDDYTWDIYRISNEKYDKLKSVPTVSINSPWIGILHNPQNMPKWFDYMHSPQSLLKKQTFTNNIDTCKGIITLSEYTAEWLKKQIPLTIPVSVLYHPTDKCDKKFSFDDFIKNNNKCIIQIGFWLRKMCAIGQIKTNIYTKIWLYCSPYVLTRIETENDVHEHIHDKCSDMHDVLALRLSNDSYDSALSKNICFLYLYDSSANNAVIECIARNTPLLINPHPAVTEYLGKNYPFYYESIQEAEEKMHNFELIKKTNLFMSNNKESQSKVSYERFINDFINCDVMKNCYKT